MNYAQIHLVLNHLPVFGTVFGILLLAYGQLRKIEEVTRIALGVFVLAALVAIPVYLTGEPAEEIVENLPGVAEAIIEQHEDAAFTALILMEITGVLALLNLFFIGRSFGRKFIAVTALSSVIAAGMILWTANLGGKIRHTEIRDSSSQTTNPGEEAETDEDDDDH
jgi:hypothetical protein